MSARQQQQSTDHLLHFQSSHNLDDSAEDIDGRPTSHPSRRPFRRRKRRRGPHHDDSPQIPSPDLDPRSSAKRVVARPPIPDGWLSRLSRYFPISFERWRTEDVKTSGSIGDDRSETQRDRDDDDDGSSSVEGGANVVEGPRPPEPSPAIIPFRKHRCEGSVVLAFLSHACFVIGSLSYLSLSNVELARARASATDANADAAPSYASDADDDETETLLWGEWWWIASSPEENDGATTMFDDHPRGYRDDSRRGLLQSSGAALFALVGALDWTRRRDPWNAVMILAGLAGVASGSSSEQRGDREGGGRAAWAWNAVSVHMYLLEAIHTLRRERDDCEEGHWCSRLGEVCFLSGSVLDCLGSYFDLAGFGELLWVAYTDVTACLLWLVCSLIDLSAEIYFLRRRMMATHNGRIIVPCVTECVTEVLRNEATDFSL